jgi:hypothetical protein
MATASATLIDRGNGLIYDSELDVTWLQNANVAGSFITWNDAIGLTPKRGTIWIDQLYKFL